MIKPHETRLKIAFVFRLVKILSIFSKKKFKKHMVFLFSKLLKNILPIFNITKFKKSFFEYFFEKKI